MMSKAERQIRLTYLTVTVVVAVTMVLSSDLALAEGLTGMEDPTPAATTGVQPSADAAPSRTSQSSGDADKVEQARELIRQRQENRALSLLREVLQHDAANREARMQMALVLGYRQDYQGSDRLYRGLLAENPGDEGAALGLIRNLLCEERLDQARSELQRALVHNPDSILLQDYSDQLGPERRSPASPFEGPKVSAEVDGGYFADSSGNRVLEATQAARYDISRFINGRLRVSQQKLSKTASGTATVLVGTGGFEIHPSKFISIFAEGGAVRFDDLSRQAIYSGDVELRPHATLSLAGGFSRFPVSPTYDATQFDLLGEGWHAGLDWHPKFVRVRGSFSRAHYSDDNRSESERGEIIHWTHGSVLAFGAGYEFSHSHFLMDPVHGYFSPNEYRRHLGELGIRFRIGRVFRAEYMGRGGVESISNGSYTPGGELRLRHRIQIRRWELGVDYSRFQVAQSTGAFEADSASGFLRYDF